MATDACVHGASRLQVVGAETSPWWKRLVILAQAFDLHELVCAAIPGYQAAGLFPVGSPTTVVLRITNFEEGLPRNLSEKDALIPGLPHQYGFRHSFPISLQHRVYIEGRWVFRVLVLGGSWALATGVINKVVTKLISI